MESPSEPRLDEPREDEYLDGRRDDKLDEPLYGSDERDNDDESYEDNPLYPLMGESEPLEYEDSPEDNAEEDPES